MKLFKPLEDYLILNHRLSRIRVFNIVTIIAFNYVVLGQIHRILCKLPCLNMHTIFWKNYMWSVLFEKSEVSYDQPNTASIVEIQRSYTEIRTAYLRTKFFLVAFKGIRKIDLPAAFQAQCIVPMEQWPPLHVRRYTYIVAVCPIIISLNSSNFNEFFGLIN